MSAMSPTSDASGSERLWLASPRIALMLGFASLVSILASVPLSILTVGGFPGIVVIPFWVVGALVARRQRWNPVGSVLLLLTFAVVASADAASYSLLVYRQGYHLPLGPVAVFLAPGSWLWLVILLPLPIALFPDGRLSRRWRWVLRAYLVFCLLVLASVGWESLTGVLAGHIQVDTGGQLASFGNSSQGSTSIRDAIVQLLYLAFGLAWVARLVLNFRGSTGDYRQQLKWLLSGGGIGLCGLLLAVTVSDSSSSFLSVVGNVGFGLGLVALPIGFGVGILKYRLYDIDRIISRTLVYGVVDGDPRRYVRRPGAGGPGRLLVVRRRVEPGDRRLDASGGGAVPAGALAGAAVRRPALLPAPLRRAADAGGLRRHGCASRSTSRR